MTILAAINYDPNTPVSKSTAALLSMTALDTTNLRLSFVVPIYGKVFVVLKTVLHGAATLPQIILGVLEGVVIRGRSSPRLAGGNVALTSRVKIISEFEVSNLTPGLTLVWDAAYGVEQAVANSAIKYGGADNIIDDAYGGFIFEIWHSRPTL